MLKKSSYHNSISKKLFDIILALWGIIFFGPFFALISYLLKIHNDGPIFFTQKRVGKRGSVFKMIKFRTMRMGAEKELAHLLHLNEVDGPVFKIRNDPRYTKFGKFLAQTGLDELPQLINVLRGEMSMVGPRPLPTYEAEKLTKGQKIRELVKPGITSTWVVEGSHKLIFSEWMRLDREYVLNANLLKDSEILLKTSLIVLIQIVRQLKRITQL